MSRKYELKKRAESMDDTRRRITEAAVDLHGSIGPARTTVTAVADRAGVQRHTVYRHFPTDRDLFAACSGLFESRNPWPDTEAWRKISDPRERLARGLDELYRYYEQTGHMWTNVLRDSELLEAVAPNVSPLEHQFDAYARVLSSGWPARGGRRRVLAAAVRHAVDFATWRSLASDGGISRAQAVSLMSALAESAAAAPDAR